MKPPSKPCPGSDSDVQVVGVVPVESMTGDDEDECFRLAVEQSEDPK